jgi:hypothetical protein
VAGRSPARSDLMPCERIDLGEGRTAIACSRGRRPAKPCCSCGRVSSLLCDYPLRGEKQGKTCDRALCAKCTWRPRVGVDYCPAHRAMTEARP